MNYLNKLNESLMLAQWVPTSAGWDLKSIATTIIIVLVVLAVVGIFLKNANVSQYLSWVPQWVWALLGLLALALGALWVIRSV